ncbi:ribosomal-protein-serine acetyltransferase [Deinococcus malanensis]|uniref:Ribosomal-protein-serine acetyltransferase n=1 Tax=Deinococcus malanensis TaxID=1706855 RepID=A0ABQ2F317_9DEIO|nr:GNAT family protein [Deinococcus malanensis]GGK42411.1 ribosomal-protein-serine acetyltransferase [Deinococcus malanensis]
MHAPVFDTLMTERLVLRHFREADAAALSAYRSDPLVAEYQAWGPSFSEEQALALIRAMRDRQPGQPGWFQFAVATRDSGALIGDIGWRSFEVRHAEVGFSIMSSMHGKGYAREAVAALLTFAFQRLKVHRVVANTDPRNLPSARLLRRLGFRHEGRALESYFDGSVWLDDDQYALLAREWSAAHAPGHA